MITITPAGLSTTALVANQESLLVTITERLARLYKLCSVIQPQASITYTTGTPVLKGTTVFVPVIANVTVDYTPSGSPTTLRQIYVESFTVAFQGQTAVPATVTIESLGTLTTPVLVVCCKSNGVTINDSITVSIA